jgi:hypothetical protein
LDRDRKIGVACEYEDSGKQKRSTAMVIATRGAGMAAACISPISLIVCILRLLEKHLENAAAKVAATKVRADSNSDGVSGYRRLNHHGRNHEASYFRDSCYFHVTTLAYRSGRSSIILA